MAFKDKGERIAADYLQRKGYRILARNFKGKGFEIDIIAKNENLIIFIEVKRRKSSDFMDPLSSINTKKKEHIIKGAKLFLLLNDIYGRCDVRFDVITIVGKDENIKHYEDAFRTK